MRLFLTYVLLIFGTSAFAEVPKAAQKADIVILGEIHDNPTHHTVQAEWVSALSPKALVFEMVPVSANVSDLPRDDADALATALDWAALGWPDFAMYYPIFAAASDAAIYGANVPSHSLMALRDTPLAVQGGPLTEPFRLDAPLPPAQQAARLELQHIAHCEAMPRDFLPMMVDAQRLRDATLADAAVRALAETAGPVVVITGNGHARADWGVPHVISLASEASVFTLGQSEAGQAPEGGFDLVLDAPGVDRPDPCAAFR